jgi:hypothetical protein
MYKVSTRLSLYKIVATHRQKKIDYINKDF